MKKSRFHQLILGAAIAAFSLSVAAQSEDTLRHVATMEAVKAQAEAMGKMADAMKSMSERAGAAPVAYQPPREVECTGFMNCTVAGFKGFFGAVKDVAQIGGAYVGPIMAYKTAIQQYDFQKVAAAETTKQVQSQQNTLQTAFSTNQNIASMGISTAGQQHAPTTQISNNSGPVNMGGTQTNGSYNPANPSAKVCAPTYSATGVPTGFTCTGG